MNPVESPCQGAPTLADTFYPAWEQIYEFLSFYILIRLDRDRVVMQCSQAAEEQLGIDAQSAIGKSLGNCEIPWDWERVDKGLKSAQREGKTDRLEEVLFRPDGQHERYLSLTIFPIQKEEVSESGFFLIGYDVTERKVLQDQLAQSQKLEAIGQLAAGIAHEINTPIQYVGDNTRFLQDAFQDLRDLLGKYSKLLQMVKSGEDPAVLIRETEEKAEDVDLDYLYSEIPDAVQQALDGVESVAEIVRAMKEFSHPGVEEKTLSDINKGIMSTITVARNEYKYVADLETDLDSDLPEVPCFPGELNQVILNMIVNAAHAIADVMKEKGMDRGLIRVSSRQDDNWAEIRISDNGVGIPEEIRSKIFDPFFTTKQVGKGTGQGLAISHSVVVEKHKGSLRLESKMGEGSTFIIRLPLKDENCEESGIA